MLTAKNAFADCFPSCPKGTTDFNGFCYTKKNSEITITCYAGSNIVVEIPSEVKGNPVISIGERAFNYCTSLTVARFRGSAPNVGVDVFSWTTSGFKVCHTAGAAGFDVEPWLSYNAQVCEPPSCSVDADCGNGVFCDGTETCAAGLCVDGTNPCEAGEICDEGLDTCDECAVNADCTDNLFCTGVETCVSGACVDGPGNPCEADETCNEDIDECICDVEWDLDGDCDVDKDDSKLLSLRQKAEKTDL